jgi:hypothetical protein
MVSWLKRPGNKVLPGNKVHLLRHYLLTCNQSEEDWNTLKHGEWPVVTDDDDVAIDITAALLLLITSENADMLPTDDAIDIAALCQH